MSPSNWNWDVRGIEGREHLVSFYHSVAKFYGFSAQATDPQGGLPFGVGGIKYYTILLFFGDIYEPNWLHKDDWTGFHLEQDLDSPEGESQDCHPISFTH